MNSSIAFSKEMKKFKCNALVMLQELLATLIIIQNEGLCVLPLYLHWFSSTCEGENISIYLHAYAGIQKLFFIFCSISFENLEKTVTVNWVANSACQGKLSFENWLKTFFKNYNILISKREKKKLCQYLIIPCLDLALCQQILQQMSNENS